LFEVLNVASEFPKPGILRMRRRGRTVTREAAVMAMPTSTTVQTIAGIEVTLWSSVLAQLWRARRKQREGVEDEQSMSD
jgi:hypothetical protein